MIKEVQNKIHENVYVKNSIQVFLIVIIMFLIECILSNYTLIGNHDNDNNRVNYKVTRDSDGYNQIEISNIGFPIRNIGIYYGSSDNSLVTYSVKTTNYGSVYSPFQYNDKWVVKGDYTKLNINSPSICEQITIHTDADDIVKIIGNDTKFCFSIFRFVLLSICGMIVLMVVKGNRRYDFDHTIIFGFAIAASLFILVFIIAENGSLDKTFYTFPDDTAYIDNYTEITYSLKHGSTSFMRWIPSGDFVKLSDPYDYSLREKTRVGYPFEASYYNGKFTSYFGITPVFEIMLPFYMITGRLLSTYSATVIYFVTLCFLLSFLYKDVVELYVDRFSLSDYLTGYILIIAGCGAFQLLRGLQYDLATVSAIVHVIISIELIFTIEKTRGVKRVFCCILTGLSMGLIVLSKPSFIVYYGLILVFMWLKGLFSANDKKTILTAILIPIICCAVFQIWYNYVRYNNPLQFGEDYSVGANIQMYGYLSIRKMIKGLIACFVTPPVYTPGIFPFITENCTTIVTDYNTLSLCDSVIGLAYVPIMYILIVRKILESFMGIDKKKKQLLQALIIVAFADIIISVTYVAINDEYLILPRLLLLLVSIVLWLFAINRFPSLKKMYMVLMILTLIVMIPCSFTNHVDLLTHMGRLNVYLKNAFEFWS